MVHVLVRRMAVLALDSVRDCGALPGGDTTVTNLISRGLFNIRELHQLVTDHLVLRHHTSRGITDIL